MFKGGFPKMEKSCGMGEELDGAIVSYSLRIINRSRTIYFFRNILGMRVICHREYEETDTREDLNIKGRWSSTILSYGKEPNYLNLELIYIYNIKFYEPGNVFKGMTIRCSRCLKRALTLGWPVLPGNVLQSPGGYTFYILDEPQPIRTDPIVKISLAVADLKASTAFYNGVIGFRFYENYFQASNQDIAILGLQPFDTKLELIQIKEPISKGENTGILGVGIEYNEQISLEERFIINKENIIIPLIPIEIPGKPMMAILKVLDPNNHEIIFYEYTPYMNTVQYSAEDESRMVKLFEDDELLKVKKSSKTFGLNTSKAGIYKDNSQEIIKLMLKQTSRSLVSMRTALKPKDSKEKSNEEAGGSSKVEMCPAFGKGITKSLGSMREFAKTFKSRSDIWKKDAKDLKTFKQKDEPTPLGDKTTNHGEQVQQEDETNYTQGNAATQEPVAIEVQASARVEAKKSRGVSNEANKSAQYSGLRIKKTSRGTYSEQRLVDSTTEDDYTLKSFKTSFTFANDQSPKDDRKSIKTKASLEDTKAAVQDSIKNIMRKTSSLLNRRNTGKSTEDMMVDGHLYFNAKFDVIPPHKIKSINKEEIIKLNEAGKSENEEEKEEDKEF